MFLERVSVRLSHLPVQGSDAVLINEVSKVPVDGGHVGVPADHLYRRKARWIPLCTVEEVGEVAIPEGGLQKPEAVLGHGVERRGPDGGGILAHLAGQVGKGDDHAQGAHELA